MKRLLISLLLPALFAPVECWAQDLQFRQEFDTIPVEINGWHPWAPFGGGESVSFPRFCDLDADSDLDLFVGNYSGYITYYENQGTGTVPHYRLMTKLWNNVNLNNSLYFGKTSPTFCDLDGDGDYDFFTGDGPGQIHFWENIGTASAPLFQWVTDSFANIDINGFTRFDFVDIDADGDFDLFLGNYYGKILFYRNVGTATNWDFSLVTNQFANIDVGYFASPKFVDIDADGDKDLFIGNQSGHIWYYRNDGDSANYNFTYVTNNYNNIWVDYYAAPEFADIDADGNYDLFVGRRNMANPNSPGDVFFYRNIGSPSQPQWELVTQNYLSICQGAYSQNHHADIDADGDVDLFSANFNSHISYYKNIGTADSAAFVWMTDSYQDLSVAPGGISINFCDINGDGAVDLFAGEGHIPNPPYPGLHLFMNHGTPQNAQFSLYSANLLPQNYDVFIRPVLADIDGDGDYDLFIADNGAGRYYFENIGTSTNPLFADPVQGWWGTFPYSYAFALEAFCFYDIDHDSDLDLFGVVTSMQTPYNGVWFYRNIGNSHTPMFELETQYFLDLERQDNFTGIDIFDIDNDGDGDIILSVAYDGGMYFFRNITGESPVPPGPKHQLPPERMITILPNPGNSGTTISYILGHPQKISLDVYNLLGAKVASLASGLQLPGNYSYTWDASAKASGIYILRFTTPDQSVSRKITILK